MSKKEIERLEKCLREKDERIRKIENRWKATTKILLFMFATLTLTGILTSIVYYPTIFLDISIIMGIAFTIFLISLTYIYLYCSLFNFEYHDYLDDWYKIKMDTIYYISIIISAVITVCILLFEGQYINILSSI